MPNLHGYPDILTRRRRTAWQTSVLSNARNSPPSLRATGEGPLEESAQGIGELPDARQGPCDQRQAARRKQKKAGNLTKDEFDRINRKADKVLEGKQGKKKQKPAPR